MIRSLIQIADGPVLDFFDAFGFVYLDSDERTAPPEKNDSVTSYPEYPGEHRDLRTVHAPFDYTAKFLVEAPNRDLANVNVKINDFNRAVRESLPGSSVLRKKEISFFNLLNRVKIVGYPEPVAEPLEVYHSPTHGSLDFAVIQLKIRVSDPALCDFELNTDNL